MRRVSLLTAYSWRNLECVVISVALDEELFIVLVSKRERSPAHQIVVV